MLINGHIPRMVVCSIKPDYRLFMFYPLSLFIGLRYTRAKRTNGFVSFISLFSTAGITIGVLALIIVLSVMNGFEQDLKVRILGAVPHITFTQSSDKEKGTQNNNTPEALTSHPDIRAVIPFIQTEAMIQSPHQIQGAIVQGINPNQYPKWDVIAQNMIVGSVQNLQAGEYNVILGRDIARLLGVRLNDKVRLISTQGSVFTPMGRVPSQRKFTVVGIFSVGSDVDSTQVLVNYADARRLTRTHKEDKTYRVYANDPFDVDAIIEQTFLAHIESSNWKTVRGELFQAVKMEKNMIGLLLFLIITVAVFNILSSLVLMVTEKEGAVAILKTLGMKNSTIVQIFVIQGAWTGVLGALAGGALGILIALNLNEILSAIGLNLLAQASGGARLLPVLFDWQQIFFIIFGAIMLSLIATLYPAFKAAGVKPAEALRYE